MATTWQTVRVFISSTFRDMHAERDHLVKVVFPRLRQWCEQRRLHLVDIDLRWGVTKEDADNGKAIEICLQEIDGSRPFFLCLLGSRYGWVPDELPPEEMYEFRGVQKGVGSLLPERPEGCSAQKTPDPFLNGLSITHLEILHAALESIPTKEGQSKPVCQQAFFYFRDPKCLPAPESLNEEDRKEYREAFLEQRPERKQMLDDLKADIRRRYGRADRVFDYTGRWDAAADNPEDELLKGRLADLQAFGERVESDVQRGIEEQFREHLAALDDEPDPLAQERALHEAFIEDRTRVHVPRIDVEERLTEYVQGDERRPLVLSGPPGSGKSAILAHWVKGIAEFGLQIADSSAETTHSAFRNPQSAFVLARFIGASPASTSLHRLMENVCRELVGRFDLQEEVEIEERAPGGAAQKVKRIQTMEIPADPVELRRKWPEFLESAAARGPVVLVLDAVNQLDASADPLWLSWIPRKLPAGLKLILSVLDHGKQSQPDYEPAPGALGEGLPTSPESPTEGLPDTATDPSRGDPRSRASAGSGDPRTAADWLRSLRRIGLASQDEKTEVPVLELDDESRRQIIHDLPSVFCKRLESPQIDLLLENQATRNPLFLLVALEELRVFGSFDKLPERIAKLPRIEQPLEIESALNAVFGQVLDRLERETHRQTPGLVPTLFRLLASAREGLSEQELSELLARQFPQVAEETRNGAMHIVLRQLRRYLMRKGTEQTALMDFYHRSFWKAVRAKYLPDEGTCRSAHAELADYFDDQEFFLESLEAQHQRVTTQTAPSESLLSSIWENDPTRTPNARKVSELPNHLAPLYRLFMAGDDDSNADRAARALSALLCDPRFIEAKAGSGLLSDLIWNYQDFLALPSINMHRHKAHVSDFAQFALRNAHLLDGCPQLARQLALWEPSDTAPAIRANAMSDTTELRPLCRLLNPPRVRPVESRRFTAHQARVSHLRYRPGADSLITCAVGAQVRLWHSRFGSLLAEFAGHQGEVLNLTVSGDGRVAATASQDRTCRLWSLEHGSLLATLHGHSRHVTDAAFSQSGDHLTTASLDGTAIVWNVATGETLTTLEAHSRGLVACAYSIDGSMIMTAGRDGTVILWDSDQFKVMRTFREQAGFATGYAFSPDDRLLAVAFSNDRVCVWDITTGTMVDSLERAGRACRFSPDGNTVVVAATGIQLWRVGHAAKKIATCTIDRNAMAQSADGTYLAFAEEELTVVDPRTGRLFVRHGLPAKASCVAWDWRGETLGIGMVSGEVIEFSVASLMSLGQPTEEASEQPPPIEIAENVVCDEWHREVLLRTSRGGRHSLPFVEELPTDRGTDSAELSIPTSCGQYTLAVASPRQPNFTVITKDLDTATRPESRRCKVTISGHSGRRVAELELDIPAVALPNFEEKRMHSISSAWVRGALMSPDGRYVVFRVEAGESRRGGRILRIWDLFAKEEVAAFGPMPSSRHFAWAISPSGHCLAACTDDGLIRLWSLRNFRIIGARVGFNAAPIGCAFSPDSEWIACIYAGGLVKCWSARTRAFAFDRQCARVPLFGLHAQDTLDQAFVGRRLCADPQSEKLVAMFSPDAKFFLCASRMENSMGSLSVWSIADGSLIAEVATPEPIRRLFGCPSGVFVDGKHVFRIQSSRLRFGPPLITPLRRFDVGRDEFDSAMRFTCAWCGHWNVVPQRIVATHYQNNAQWGKSESAGIDSISADDFTLSDLEHSIRCQFLMGKGGAYGVSWPETKVTTEVQCEACDHKSHLAAMPCDASGSNLVHHAT